ncbi:MAG: hypothetical protein KF724_11440 [Phycisphaeraceae bacterium]|nr:hypothetical protein [Phycisphaeraceae bacterium]
MESLFAELRKQTEASQETHKAVVEAPEYRAELARLDRLMFDFIATLRLCWFATTRAGDWVDKSLFMRSIDDLMQSAVLVRMAVHEGARNSARRELRYMIELAIKALFVDQKMPTSPLEHRLVFFDRKLDPASITPVKELSFHNLTAPDAERVVKKLLAAYSRACEYVHPSVRQIEERLELAAKGVSPGFETAAELRQSNDEVFEGYSLVLVLLFEAIGSSFAGDIWEAGGLSDREDWVFHGHPLVAEIDAYFDYKAERQERLQVIKDRRANRLAYAKAVDWPVLKSRDARGPSDGRSSEAADRRQSP